jgi:hypothetical protein
MLAQIKKGNWFYSIKRTSSLKNTIERRPSREIPSKNLSGRDRAEVVAGVAATLMQLMSVLGIAGTVASTGPHAPVSCPFSLSVEVRGSKTVCESISELHSFPVAQGPAARKTRARARQPTRPYVPHAVELMPSSCVMRPPRCRARAPRPVFALPAKPTPAAGARTWWSLRTCCSARARQHTPIEAPSWPRQQEVATHWRPKCHHLTLVRDSRQALQPCAVDPLLKEEEGDVIVYESAAWQRREGRMTNHGVTSTPNVTECEI